MSDAEKRTSRWLIAGIVVGVLAVIGLVVEPHEKGKTAETDTGSASHLLEPCGDTGGFHVCVEKAELRASLSNAIETATAGAGTTFLLVRLSLTSSKHDTVDVGWSDFTLRSGRDSWDPDTNAQLNVSAAGYQTLNIADQLHPGTAIGGWIVFRVPTAVVSSLYLRFKPSFVKKIDLSLPLPVPGSCRVGSQVGTCMDVAQCSGKHVSGLCDGASNIQCCIK